MKWAVLAGGVARVDGAALPRGAFVGVEQVRDNVPGAPQKHDPTREGWVLPAGVAVVVRGLLVEAGRRRRGFAEDGYAGFAAMTFAAYPVPSLKFSS